jgi:NAD(P)-dependent dehydrogenase (short-subunit alcohol dehydrogenase family)
MTMPSVLITSANRGLGLEFARQYLAEGWRVFGACREPRKASELRDLPAKSGGQLDVLQMDVTDRSSVDRAVASVGDNPIDVLINSAGVMGKRQTVGKVAYSEWAQVLDVNTMGPLRVLEAFLENVARSSRKVVVTITSGMGSIADNTSGSFIPYRSSKAAVNMVMRTAAIDLTPRGISCVVVNPGWVRTDMGGESAPLSAQESVSALKRLIQTLGPAQSGKFFNYDGKEYPW